MCRCKRGPSLFLPKPNTAIVVSHCCANILNLAFPMGNLQLQRGGELVAGFPQPAFFKNDGFNTVCGWPTCLPTYVLCWSL